MNYLSKQFNKFTVKVYFYTIINLINGKCYIGQTIDTEKRFNEHVINSKSKSKKLQKLKLYRAIRKYKLKNFQFYILPIVKYGQNAANEEEKRLIKLYNTFSKTGECDGYNMTEGGYAVGSGVNHPSHGKPSPHKGKKYPQCSGENHWSYNKSFSEEHRQNMRKNHADISGKNNPMYNVPSPMTGKFGELHPLYNKVGEDNPSSKWWRITFDDGRTIEVHGLRQWSKENNYNVGHLVAISKNKRKRHKDIIKVEKLN